MKERIAIWDNYKFLLILLVVVGHIAQDLSSTSKLMHVIFNYIYLFHMPAFLFVSGLFSKRTINEKNVTKVLPYFTCFVATVILQFIFKAILLGKETLSFFQLGGLPWFLLSLLSMYLITMITKNYKPAYIIVFSIILGIFVGFSKEQDYTLFSWMRTVIYYPFFYVGYLTDPSKIVKIMNKAWLKILAIVFFVGLFAICYIKPEFFNNIFCLMTAKHPYSHMKELQNWGWAFRIMLYTVSFIASYLLISIVPKKKIWLITQTGKRTLTIYMFHFLFVYLVTRIFTVQNILAEALPVGDNIVMILIGVIITFISSNKLFDWCTQKLISIDWKLKKDKE